MQLDLTELNMITYGIPPKSRAFLLCSKFFCCYASTKLWRPHLAWFTPKLFELFWCLEHYCCWSIILITNKGLLSIKNITFTVITIKLRAFSSSYNSEHLDTKSYFILENLAIQFSNCFSTSCCQSLSTDDVKTKCFSSRLMSGIGNFLCTVSLSAITINLQVMKPEIQWIATHTAMNIQLTWSCYVHGILHGDSEVQDPHICCPHNANSTGLVHHTSSHIGYQSWEESQFVQSPCKSLSG